MKNRKKILALSFILFSVCKTSCVYFVTFSLKNKDFYKYYYLDFDQKNISLKELRERLSTEIEIPSNRFEIFYNDQMLVDDKLIDISKATEEIITIIDNSYQFEIDS